MDNREREERERRAAEIEARRQAAQQRIEDHQRRAREKYGEEKGPCPEARKPVQGQQQGPRHLK